jgi:hypothetical protein
MKIVDIADEIYRELGNPTDLSISVISFWVRTNIGELNNLLMANFAVNASTLEIEDDCDPVNEITPEAVSVLKKMYFIHNYDLEIKKNLISISTDSIIEVSDQGSSVRKINRNEVSKTLSGLRKQEVDGLVTLVTAYRSRSAEPRQVAGDDTIEGEFRINDTTLRNWMRY